MHINVDGLAHSVIGTTANMADLNRQAAVLQGAICLYLCGLHWAGKRYKYDRRRVVWPIAACCSTYRPLGKGSLLGQGSYFPGSLTTPIPVCALSDR